MQSIHRHGNLTMLTFGGRRCGYLELVISLLALLLIIYTNILGCGGGGGGSNNTGSQSRNVVASRWENVPLARIEAGGMLSPRVKAARDAQGTVHLAYFQDDDNTAAAYQIQYLVLDNPTGTLRTLSSSPEPEPVTSIDNCAALSLALGQDNLPVISYRGGTVRECGREQQSDAMLSLKAAGGWGEYTGAVGIVERNPVFQDGLAGTEVSVAVDSEGAIHLAYQFFYEGCDAMNYRYPDLCYVKKDRSALSAAALEETVEGNHYDDGSNVQNSVGYHCVITLDSGDNPVIFYYAELPGNTRGLRVARRQQGIWEKEWIEEGCVVGSISGARCDAGGFLGVAYYVEEYGDGRADHHCLRYAEEEASSWRIQMVDDTSWCGDYCSLAYDAAGSAAIAYYELKSHSGYAANNLRFAQLQEGAWKRETMASSGDIGLYNSLWFDGRNRPVICSYSGTERTIYLFHPAQV